MRKIYLYLSILMLSVGCSSAHRDPGNSILTAIDTTNPTSFVNAYYELKESFLTEYEIDKSRSNDYITVSNESAYWYGWPYLDDAKIVEFLNDSCGGGVLFFMDANRNVGINMGVDYKFFSDRYYNLLEKRNLNHNAKPLLSYASLPIEDLYEVSKLASILNDERYIKLDFRVSNVIENEIGSIFPAASYVCINGDKVEAITIGTRVKPRERGVGLYPVIAYTENKKLLAKLNESFKHLKNDLELRILRKNNYEKRMKAAQEEYERKESVIRRHNEANEKNWKSRYNIDLIKGSKVCSHVGNIFGFVDDVSGDNYKIQLVGKLDGYKDGYFFGNIPLYNSLTNDDKYQFTYSNLSGYTWMRKGELSICDFRP